MATTQKSVPPDPNVLARRYADAKALLMRQGATPEEADEFLAEFPPAEGCDSPDTSEVVVFGRGSPGS